MKKLFVFTLILLMAISVKAFADDTTWSGRTSSEYWEKSGNDTYYDDGDVAIGGNTFIELLTIEGISALILDNLVDPAQSDYTTRKIKESRINWVRGQT
jgi:hypothetical protein